MRLELTAAIGLALAMTVVACGGTPTSTAPSAPSPVPSPVPSPTPTPVPSPPAAPLPLGQAAAGGNVSCPTGPPASSTCSSLVVACPSIAGVTATLRITRPPSTAATRGTVVFTTGGDGTNFQDSPLTPAMIATLTGDGLTAVQLRWDPPGIWGGPRARTMACRSATAVRWIYDNVHAGGRSRLFAAQGTSGGSAQIAFGLGHYGIGDYLDLANLGGGPPNCPLCSSDGQNAPEPLIPISPGGRNPVVNYPATTVRFFLGDQEPTPEIIADANAFHNAITSARSFMTVPGTAHNIEGTQAGVDAYVASVRAALK